MLFETARIWHAPTALGVSGLEVAADYSDYVSASSEFRIAKAPPLRKSGSSIFLASFDDSYDAKCLVGEIVYPPLVSVLLTEGSPAKIARKVSLIVVDTVKSHSFRTLSKMLFNIASKCSITKIFVNPRLVDLNAASTIVLIVLMAFVVASSYHSSISVVIFGLCIAVLSWESTGVLIVRTRTTAAGLMPSPQIGGLGFKCIRAVAKNFPYKTIVVSKQFLHNSMTKSLVDKIHRSMASWIGTTSVLFHVVLLILTITLFNGGI
jgi:hypothetical protein